MLLILMLIITVCGLFTLAAVATVFQHIVVMLCLIAAYLFVGIMAHRLSDEKRAAATDRTNELLIEIRNGIDSILDRANPEKEKEDA